MERRTVLVCGSREWKNQKYLHDVLDKLHAEKPVTAVGYYHPYSSAAMLNGAEKHAATWAQSNGITRIEVADYYKEVRDNELDFEGPFKHFMWINERILDVVNPQVVLAFHDYIEKSQASADLLNRAAYRTDVFGQAKMLNCMMEVMHFTQFSQGQGAHWLTLNPPVMEEK